MSISRDILDILDFHTKTHLELFAFYLDAYDELFSLQSRMGLDEPAMRLLAEENQNIFKAHLFLVESANTTWAASLRLLSSGFVADAYSLIRILYEIAALLHYSNSCPPSTRKELYHTVFKSGLSEDNHRKKEWVLIRKAEALFENEFPGLVPVRRELNNFGSHISRSKVVLGNITSLGCSAVSRVFAPAWTNRRYLAALDFLFNMMAMILEEYAKTNAAFGGITEQVYAEVKGIVRNFTSAVRPRLQRMIQ
jgi:hypothetical protein